MCRGTRRINYQDDALPIISTSYGTTSLQEIHHEKPDFTIGVVMPVRPAKKDEKSHVG
jgi:hypothetical protein